MLRQNADRFVEHDMRQGAGIDVAQKVLAILEMLGAILGARREAREIIERLMVRLEIRAAVAARIDDAALLLVRPAAVLQRQVPTARIPSPADVLRRQRIADRLRGLRRER